MRVKFPLYAQTVSLVAGNLVLLLVLGALIFFSPLKFGWDAIIASPLGARVQEISWTINRTLETRPESDWTEILDEFGKVYGVHFYLFDDRGEEVAGKKIKLPATLLSKDVLQHRLMGPPDWVRGPGGPAGPLSLDFHGPPPNEFPGPPPGEFPGPPPGEFPGPPPGEFPGPPPGEFPGPPPGEFPGPPPGEFLGGPPGDFRGVAVLDHANPPVVPSATLHHIITRQHIPMHRYLEHTSDPDCFWIVVHVPIFRHNPNHVVPGSLIAQADNLLQTRMFFDFGPIVFIACAVVSLSLLFWTPFAYKLSRNLRRLTRATEQIAEGRFDSKVEHNTVDEMGLLGESINKMADKLNNFVSGEKRFLGDIAHELCSPIARLQVAFELLEDTKNDTQTQLLKDIKEEIDEMSTLINELLAFSKAGLQGTAVELVPLNAFDLISEVARKHCAEEIIKVEVQSDLWVMGDRTLLQRAFGNLVRNSVRYAGQGANIRIEGSEKQGNACIKVLDDGPGVPPDLVARLGEPFFRPEPSRNRSSGGVGLGLAIVQACVKACNGSFKISNRSPHGLAVEIDLPACVEPSH